MSEILRWILRLSVRIVQTAGEHVEKRLWRLALQTQARILVSRRHNSFWVFLKENDVWPSYGIDMPTVFQRFDATTTPTDDSHVAS